MPEAASVLANIKFRTCHFLDGLRFLVVQHQSRGEEQRLLAALQKHAGFADIKAGSPPRRFDLVLTVVNPDPEGLRLLAAACPWLVPRDGEIALDWCVDSRIDAELLHRFYDQHQVQRWHRTQETCHYNGTTYTGRSHRPGHGFVAYSDRPSKADPESFCCHIEARYQGIVALRSIGINAASDWLSFDHHAFWKKHLFFYEIDLSRLGRWYENKRTGKRRQRPRLHRSGKFCYNIDRATGSVLFRIFGRHSTEQAITVQRIVDRFGRNPALRSIDPSRFLPGEDIILMTRDTEDFIA
jgi:hypothetical protein